MVEVGGGWSHGCAFALVLGLWFLWQSPSVLKSDHKNEVMVYISRKLNGKNGVARNCVR